MGRLAARSSVFFVVCAVWASLISASQDSGAAECNSLGKPLPGVEYLTLDAVIADASLDGQNVVLDGVASGVVSHFCVCAVGLRGGEKEREELRREIRTVEHACPPSCILYDPRRLGRHVIRQWNGDRVRVWGRLRQLALPQAPERVRSIHLDRVDAVQLLDRPASESFCPDYEGPLEEAPFEDLYDPPFGLYRGFSLLETHGAYSGEVKLHWYRALATHEPPRGSKEAEQEPEVIEFEVAPPYAGRDISEFAALSKYEYVFSLRSGELYLWRRAEGLRLLEPASESARLLMTVGDGCVYYVAGRPDETIGTRDYSLRRVNRKLRVETVWESPEAQIVGLDYDETGVELKFSENQVEQEIKLAPCSPSEEPGYGDD